MFLLLNESEPDRALRRVKNPGLVHSLEEAAAGLKLIVTMRAIGDD